MSRPTTGTINEYHGNWIVDFRLDGERFRRKLCPLGSDKHVSRKLADDLWTRHRSDLLRGDLGILETNTVTFAEAIEHYREYFLANCKCYEMDGPDKPQLDDEGKKIDSLNKKSMWSRLATLTALFGKKLCHGLMPKEINTWVWNRTKADLNSSRYVGTIKAIMARAVKDGLIEMKHNHLAGLEAPAEDERRTQVIRPDELGAILAGLYGHLVEINRDCLVVMSHGAFRPSEAVQLRWDWIFKDRVELPAWFHKTGKKTKKPVIKPKSKEMDECFERIAHRTGYVFSLDGGKTYIPQATVADNFKRAAVRAGVRCEKRKTKGGKVRIVADVQLRDLRRSTATILIENGARLGAVSQMLGHTSLEQTQHYLCLRDDHCLDLGPSISAALAPPQAAKVIHLFKK